MKRLFTIIFFTAIYSCVFAIENRWHATYRNTVTGEQRDYAAKDFFTSNGGLIPDFDKTNSDWVTEYVLDDTSCCSKDFLVVFEYEHLSAGGHVSCGQEYDTPTTPIFSEAPKKNALKNATVQTMSCRKKDGILRWTENGVQKSETKNSPDSCPRYNFYVKWKKGGGIIKGFHYYDYENGYEVHETFTDPNSYTEMGNCHVEQDQIITTAVKPTCKDDRLKLIAKSIKNRTLNWVDPSGTAIGMGDTLIVDDGLNIQEGWYRVWTQAQPCLPGYDVDSVYIDIDNSYETDTIEERYTSKEIEAYLEAYGTADATPGLHVIVDTIPPADGELCGKITIHKVMIEWTNVEPASVVTPNGDGIHDNWEIKGLTTYKSYSVKIYDRRGKLIYKSVNQYDGWDATYNGVPVPSGDYWYDIDIDDSDDYIIGHFTVLR